MSGTHDAVVMIEGEAKEVSEQILTEAMAFGHQYIQKLVSVQLDLKSALAATNGSFS